MEQNKKLSARKRVLKIGKSHNLRLKFILEFRVPITLQYIVHKQ